MINVNYMTIGDSDNIAISKKAKNLGVYLDSTLSMEDHINNLCRVLNFELRRLGQIRQFLNENAVKTLVCSFILSRLDYCNSLLYGISKQQLNRLQRIQNHAARLVLRKSKHNDSFSLLKQLHWLPVEARINYKIAVTVYQCLNNQNFPQYLTDILVPYTPSRSLRSSNTNRLYTPRVHLKTYGERAFSYSGPVIWNSLPENLKQAKTIDCFKKHLKTHLFKLSFN